MDRENCATEIGKKMKSAVKAKLLEICGDNQAGFADDELPEYVMIMVANKKTKQQMINDLKLFLDNKTELFVSWLHEVLQKLEKVKVPVAAQKEKSEDSRRFNEAEEMLSRKKIKKERAAKNANDKLASDVDRKEKLEHISQRDEEKLVRKMHIKVEKSKQTERTAEARAVEDGGGGGGASSSAQKSNEFFVLTGDREKDLAELAKLEEQIKEAKKYLKVNELEDDDDEDVYSIDESKDDTSTQASSRRRKSPIVFDLEASGEPHNKMSKREGSYSADMRSSKDFYGSEYRKNEHTNDSYGNYAKYSKDSATDRNEYSRGFDSNKSKERNDFRRNDYYNNDQQSKRNNNNNNMRNNFRSNDFQRRNNNNNNNTQSFRRNDNQQQQHRNNYQRNDNNFSRGHHNNSNNDSRTSSNRRNDFKDNNNFRRNDVSSNDSRMNRRNNFTSFKDRDNSNYNDARRSSSRDGHKNNLSNSFLSNHSSSGKRRSRSKETTYRNPFSNTYRPTSNKRSMSKEKNHFAGKSSFTQLKDRDDKRSERNDYRRNDVRSTSSHRDDYRRKDSSRARDSHRDERAKNDRNKISRDSHRDRNSSERDRERYYDDDVALRDRLGKQRSRR